MFARFARGSHAHCMLSDRSGQKYVILFSSFEQCRVGGTPLGLLYVNMLNLDQYLTRLLKKCPGDVRKMCLYD